MRPFNKIFYRVSIWALWLSLGCQKQPSSSNTNQAITPNSFQTNLNINATGVAIGAVVNTFQIFSGPIGSDQSVNIQWTSVIGAAFYTLVIAGDHACSNASTIFTKTLSASSPASYSTVYSVVMGNYICVYALDQNGNLLGGASNNGLQILASPTSIPVAPNPSPLASVAQPIATPIPLYH